jgi:SAM-dependent methyltransferase
MHIPFLSGRLLPAAKKRPGMTHRPLPPDYPLAQVFTGIDNLDEMYAGNPAHYYAVGLSALDCIERGLARAGRDSVDSILDFPCGHGRVSRVLRARFPRAALTVGDINREGVDFCVRHFQATGLYSDTDFTRIRLETRFDLIWVGSLITHFPADMTMRFLDFITARLNDNGLLVMSSHGPFVAGHIGRDPDRNQYGLRPADARTMLRDYFTTGYGYAGYPGQPGYGISVVKKTWFERLALPGHCVLVDFSDNCWDNHHDMVTILHPPAVVPGHASPA